jgi:hypothetical protein
MERRGVQTGDDVHRTDTVRLRPPTCLAANTRPQWMRCGRWVSPSPRSLAVRHGQCRDHPHHAAEQPSVQVPRGQQQPVIARMFHQPSAGLHRPSGPEGGRVCVITSCCSGGL